MGVKNQINVLIVEDEKMALSAYVTLLEGLEKESKYEFHIETAANCLEAHQQIEKALTGQFFDLVLLDIRIPAYKNGNLFSGEDVGIKIKATMPNAKIILYTQYNDPYLLYNLFTHVKPESLLFKGEIGAKMLKEAILKVLDGNIHHCQLVTKMISKQVQFENPIDKKDRQLLYELSQGAKMKELSDILKTSITTVESKKRNLKIIFDAIGNSDRSLIQAAREKGFL